MTSKQTVMLWLGVLALAGGISSFWGAVLNAIANHVVVQSSYLLAYALGVVIGVLFIIWGGAGMKKGKR